LAKGCFVDIGSPFEEIDASQKNGKDTFLIGKAILPVEGTPSPFRLVTKTLVQTEHYWQEKTETSLDLVK
jgi:hypothetical protein